jgi:hypothetical protein
MTNVAFVAVLAAVLAAAALGQTPKPKPRSAPEGIDLNGRPSVKLAPSADRVTVSCHLDTSVIPLCGGRGTNVKLSARASDPDGDALLYTYSTTGGRVTGDGPEVTLDLTGVTPGVYAVTVEVDDGIGGTANDTANVTVEYCPCDPEPTPPPCPTVTMSCPDTPEPDGRMDFKANVSGGDPSVTPTFNWTVAGGTITGGQGASSITVDITGVTNTVTATVDVGGYDRSCQTVASCTLNDINGPVPLSRKVDEYGVIKLKDEWARLDKFAAELQNDPTAQGFFVCYGGRRSTAGEAQRRCDRAMKYTSRYPWASDPARLVTVDAGYRCEPSVELWAVPSGAEPPADAPLTIPEPKPSASKCRPPRRRVRP